MKNSQITLYEHVPWERLPQWLAVSVDGVEHRLRLLHSGRERHGRRRQARRYGCHAHGVYHIVLYLDAADAIRIDDCGVPLSPRTLVMTRPGQRHHFHPQSAAPFDYREITFAYESSVGMALQWPLDRVIGALSGMDTMNTDHLVIHLSADQSTLLCGLLERFDHLAHADAASGMFLAYQAVAAVFAFLAEDVLVEHPVADISRNDEIVLRVRDFLESNCHRSIQVADAAARAGLSPRQLQRRFKTAFGRSLMDYLVECRIRHAKRLLRESGLRIGEISERLGFSSAFYFSSVFNRRVGQSPSAYRRSGMIG